MDDAHEGVHHLSAVQGDKPEVFDLADEALDLVGLFVEALVDRFFLGVSGLTLICAVAPR